MPTKDEGAPTDAKDKDKKDEGQAQAAGEAFTSQDIATLAAEIVKDPTGGAKHIKELRKENEKRRKANDELETLQKRVADMEAAKEKLEAASQKAEEARLAEEGKAKEATAQAEQRLREATASKAALEAAQKYEKAYRQALEARIRLIPEDKRTLVPESLDPINLGQWLDKNEALLKQRQAPPLDEGKGGKQGERKTTEKALKPASY